MRRIQVRFLVIATVACNAPQPPPPESLVGPACARPTAADSASADTSLVDQRALERRPRMVGLLRRPRYPQALRQAGIQGRVLLDAIIDRDGFIEPQSIRAVQTTHMAFVAPAMEVLATARFCPGRLDGRRVRVRIQVPINFRVSGQ